CAVDLERCGPVFAGNKGGDKCPARFVPAADEPHREPAATLVDAEVQAQRADGTSAATRLLRIEEAEKHPAGASGGNGGEGAGSGEFVIQRSGRRQRGGIRSRSAGAFDAPADF